MMGYFFVYLGESYLERKDLYSDLSMTLPSETIVNFQIPLTYYPQPNREPEEVRGEFVYNGKYYDLNKQWVKNDTLFIEAFRERQTKNASTKPLSARTRPRFRPSEQDVAR